MICWISRLPVLCWPGQHPEVFLYLKLAAAVGVAAEDKDLAARVRSGHFQQYVAHRLAGEEG